MHIKTAMAISCLVLASTAQASGHADTHAPAATAPTATASAPKKAIVKKADAAPCAILDKFDGDVQIMDSARNELLLTTARSTIPCGGWVSTHEGWAELRDRENHVYRLGPQTFVEVFDHEAPTAGRDQLVLFRGKVWVKAPGGAPEFRVSTPNGRVTSTRGEWVVAYSAPDEETQLLVATGDARISNRFLQQRWLPVKAGEMSSLNLRMLRVVPSAAAAVDMASAKEFISNLPLSEKERRSVVAAVRARLDRKFASTVAGKPAPARAPASQAKRKVADNGEGEKTWKEHLTGGEPGTENILHPAKKPGRKGVKVQVADPGLDLDRKKFKQEEAEKQRLIDELSKLNPE
jgi:hypothetical protein